MLPLYVTRSLRLYGKSPRERTPRCFPRRARSARHRRSMTARPAPTRSIPQSPQDPVLPGEKLCRYSSTAATPATMSRICIPERSRANRNCPLRARAKSAAKRAYSTTWANFRIPTCTASRVSGSADGSRRRSRGMSHRDVCAAPHVSEENLRITPVQITTGSHRTRTVRISGRSILGPRRGEVRERLELPAKLFVGTPSPWAPDSRAGTARPEDSVTRASFRIPLSSRAGSARRSFACARRSPHRLLSGSPDSERAGTPRELAGRSQGHCHAPRRLV